MAKSDIRDVCLKCQKECNLNASGICTPCRSSPCSVCRVSTTSKTNPVLCSACSKLSKPKRDAIRAKAARK